MILMPVFMTKGTRMVHSKMMILSLLRLTIRILVLIGITFVTLNIIIMICNIPFLGGFGLGPFSSLYFYYYLYLGDWALALLGLSSLDYVSLGLFHFNLGYLRFLWKDLRWVICGLLVNGPI